MQTLTPVRRRGWSGQIASLPLSFFLSFLVSAVIVRVVHEYYCRFESKPMSRLQQNSAHLITSARGPPKPNLVQIHPLGASGDMGEI